MTEEIPKMTTVEGTQEIPIISRINTGKGVYCSPAHNCFREIEGDSASQTIGAIPPRNTIMEIQPKNDDWAKEVDLSEISAATVTDKA